MKALLKTLNKDTYIFLTSFLKLSKFPLQSFGLELPSSKAQGKSTKNQAGSLNFIQQGLRNVRHTCCGKAFPTRLFKDEVLWARSSNPKLSINAAFGSPMDTVSLLWPSIKLSPLPPNWGCCMLERSAPSFIVEFIYCSMPKYFEAADVWLLMCSNYHCISSTLYQLSTK